MPKGDKNLYVLNTWNLMLSACLIVTELASNFDKLELQNYIHIVIYISLIFGSLSYKFRYYDNKESSLSEYFLELPQQLITICGSIIASTVLCCLMAIKKRKKKKFVFTN